MPDPSVFSAPMSWLPQGDCYRWQPTVAWLQLGSDSVIVLADYVIAATLFYFAFKRQDLPFRWVFGLLGVFIVVGSTTYGLDVWTLWHPTYWLAVSLKLLTAIVAVVTALVLGWLRPQALALPSLDQWVTANTRLREAQRIAHVGDWDYDVLTQTGTWSEELFYLFGLPPAPLAPTYKVRLQLYTPESQAQLDQARQSATTTGTPYALELQCTTVDGAASWLLVRGEAVRETAGTVVRLVGTASDITQSKQREVELRDINALKDDFLSTVSHELRTPLTSIKLAVHMLELSFGHCEPTLPAVFGDAFATKVSRYMAILATECERELSLVNELLELQRLESGVVIPEWATLNLLEWLPDLVAVYEARAHSRALTLCLQLPESLPPLVSDAALLKSVLRELLTNACKYTPPSGRISVQAGQTDSTLQLSVSNTGTAIPPDELPRLFEKFYRLPGRDPWQQGGTGLGLALAQRQVERLGGNLQVTSDDAQTVFSLFLPLAP